MFKRKMMRFTPENIGSDTKRKSFIRKGFHDMSRTGRCGFSLPGAVVRRPAAAVRKEKKAMESYQQPPRVVAKKTGRKREKSPCTPYKRKARGKESKPGALGTCLSRATRVRAHVRAAVEDALAAFRGTRGPAPSDEALWANFAWRFGYAALLEAVYQGECEMAEHETPIPDADKPKILQAILNRFWMTRKGGAE